MSWGGGGGGPPGCIPSGGGGGRWPSNLPLSGGGGGMSGRIESITAILSMSPTIVSFGLFLLVHETMNSRIPPIIYISLFIPAIKFYSISSGLS